MYIALSERNSPDVLGWTLRGAGEGAQCPNSITFLACTQKVGATIK